MFRKVVFSVPFRRRCSGSFVEKLLSGVKAKSFLSSEEQEVAGDAEAIGMFREFRVDKDHRKPHQATPRRSSHALNPKARIGFVPAW